ncbi:hypothetical protein Poly30_55790 [Planctomycetes bacterium Poly30]|uniref:Inner membrane protein YjdF n=1 Tax=Saltatorellus ferox TaxID=2528018 RepID=A0A518F101_9BACT|nr:hypothetical protein Poly30_55790 [Planctomycetes bacterium Poly30]
MHRRELPILVFTALYIAAAIPAALRTGSGEFVFYIAVLFVLAALVWTVHRKVQLTLLTLWGFSIWGLAHMAGGLWTVSESTGVLYNLWLIPGRLKYDQVVHAYGFGLSTWLCWQALSRSVGIERPTLGLLTLCALAGMGLGAANEIVEFIAVLTIPETNVGGYENTGWDLVANAVGATVAAVLIRVADSKGRAPRVQR